MTLGTILKLLHVLAAFGLVGGEIGRALVFQRAKRATDIKIVAEMLDLFMFLTTRIVSPSGGLVFLLGLVTAWAQGWAFLGFLHGVKTLWLLLSLVLFVVIMLIIMLVLAPRGKAMGQALGAAGAQGKITPELTAAMNDSALNNGMLLNEVLMVVIIVLMVLKPF